jgi:hypothetical protein
VAAPLPDIPNPLDWFGNLDPCKWAGDILKSVLTTIGQALLEAVRGFVDWALGFGDSSLNFVTRTPGGGSYGSPTVRALWDFSRAIVNVLLAVIVMCLHGVGQGHNAAEGLPGKSQAYGSSLASRQAGHVARWRLPVVTATPAAERRIADVVECGGGTAPALLVAHLTTDGRLVHAGALGEVWRTADGGGWQAWW